MIREAERKDLGQLLELYTQLGDNKVPQKSDKLSNL